ncbi:MAG: tRNA uridine-5-carboxymethylaminomethyl(34) synthesis GTPase MnmE [Lachnospiraceae bacterium]|nr:tRNA uridine-5-carboxymethylaminomethyl(34) synthesis GTPase MnmE [Lachnospiraceae bacterium]
MKTETIAAIATALSESGISIIRISGKEAIEIADKIFQTKGKKHILKNAVSHTIHYGFIYEEDELVDEVMVSVMRAPHSYTTEDTVEINCHGGVLITKRILEIVLKNGAVLAQPGEFTKRAFLNGRIDLSEAEAVMDMIKATNELALKSSLSQLRGSVSEVIRNLREKIIYEIAFIESALDDPEHISTEGYKEKLEVIVEELLFELKKLLDRADCGKMMKEGIRTVILGKPNAGKSSLLNLLAGEEKAIVTDIAGTTRDALEESIKIRGIGLNVIDTAGIRFTDDVVEKIGVEKAIRFAKDADLILYVVDSSTPLDKNDLEIFSLIEQKNAIILFNKTDLPAVVTEAELFEKCGGSYPVIKISTVENIGMEELEETIQTMFFRGKISFENEVYLTNIRHKEAVREAYESLLLVKNSIDLDMPEDFYSIDLMSAYAALGRIIGEEVGEDLVNEIFSKFCMGK